MKITSIFISFCIFTALLLSQNRAYSQATSNSTNALSHRIYTCEVEIDMLKKNVEIQEEAREALDRDIKKILKATKESTKESLQDSQKKTNEIEKQIERLCIDIKEIKNHSNELSKSLNELSKSLVILHEKESSHSKAIESLEKAMRSLTLALKGKKTVSDSPAFADIPTKTPKQVINYIVKSGDSLEKIARAHKMTLQSLKEMNALSSTKIKQGQELKVYSVEE